MRGLTSPVARASPGLYRVPEAGSLDVVMMVVVTEAGEDSRTKQSHIKTWSDEHSEECLSERGFNSHVFDQTGATPKRRVDLGKLNRKPALPAMIGHGAAQRAFWSGARVYQHGSP